jgi:hypothetical protein
MSEHWNMWRGYTSEEVEKMIAWLYRARKLDIADDNDYQIMLRARIHKGLRILDLTTRFPPLHIRGMRS